jgi:hypothetical protein
MPVFPRTISYNLIPSKTKEYVKIELIILDLRRLYNFFPTDDKTSTDYEFHKVVATFFKMLRSQINPYEGSQTLERLKNRKVVPDF